MQTPGRPRSGVSICAPDVRPRRFKKARSARASGVPAYYTVNPGRPGTNHTAGSPPRADIKTRSPPATGSTRKCQPWNRPRTRQPPGIASQRWSATHRSIPPAAMKARNAARAANYDRRAAEYLALAACGPPGEMTAADAPCALVATMGAAKPRAALTVAGMGR